MISGVKYIGSPCKNGHSGERYIVNRQCVECTRNRGKVWKQNNPEKRKQHFKKWYYANADEQRARVRTYHVKNREKRLIYSQKWSSEHRQLRNEYLRKWKLDNPGKASAKQMAREAAKLLRTPIWARTPEHLMEVMDVYRFAKELTQSTGIEHQVDHFYPLRGRNVSGLHVAANLRVVTAHENHKKYNKHPEEIS